MAWLGDYPCNFTTLNLDVYKRNDDVFFLFQRRAKYVNGLEESFNEHCIGFVIVISYYKEISGSFTSN